MWIGSIAWNHFSKSVLENLWKWSGLVQACLNLSNFSELLSYYKCLTIYWIGIFTMKDFWTTSRVLFRKRRQNWPNTSEIVRPCLGPKVTFCAFVEHIFETSSDLKLSACIFEFFARIFFPLYHCHFWTGLDLFELVQSRQKWPSFWSK